MVPPAGPVKRLLDGELAELRAQLIDLLDRGWMMMNLDPTLDGGARSGCSLRTQARRWKRSFRSQPGQFEWNVVPFGLQWASSSLTRVKNQALTVGLAFPGDLSVSPPTGADVAGPGAPAASLRQPQSALAPAHGGVPGASGPLGR